MSKQHTTSKVIRYYGEPATIFVEYGIDYEFAAKHNQAACFSITADIYKNKADGTCNKTDRNFLAGGCHHEEILKAFPGFSDLVAFHLRHADGSPSYAVGNGLYWAEFCLGISPWKVENGKDYKKIFCDHLLISEFDANTILEEIRMAGESATLAAIQEIGTADSIVISIQKKVEVAREQFIAQLDSVLEHEAEIVRLFVSSLPGNLTDSPKETEFTPKYDVSKAVYPLFDFAKNKAEAILKSVKAAKDAAMNAVLQKHVDALAPIWKQKADALIQKYDLGEK